MYHILPIFINAKFARVIWSKFYFVDILFEEVYVSVYDVHNAHQLTFVNTQRYWPEVRPGYCKCKYLGGHKTAWIQF